MVSVVQLFHKAPRDNHVTHKPHTTPQHVEPVSQPKPTEPIPPITVNMNVTHSHEGPKPRNEAQAVLNNPDASIYVIRKSSWCKEHPRAEDIIFLNDYTAMLKMEKERDPVATSPRLDASPVSGAPMTIAPAPDNSLFEPAHRPKPIPQADALIWLARPQGFSRADGIPLSLPKKPEAEPVLIPAPFNVIPPQDGALWLARGNKILPMREPRV